MIKKETKYFCDICKEETNEKDCFRVNYPVIFTTNQTDGVSSKPYIEQKQIDICRYCAEKVLKITASGCQGYNEYKVINEGSKWQKLKEWLEEVSKILDKTYACIVRHNGSLLLDEWYKGMVAKEILDKMQELEGEDENTRK